MSDSSSAGSLHVQVQKRVATIEFGHPAANSFPIELLGKLTQVLHKINKDKGVSIILLKSKGDKVFSAGAFFEELQAIQTIDQGEQFFNGFANVLNAMRTCGKIIVGRIQGKVVGGGVGLVAACDYTLASIDASVKLSELTIGIGPFVIAAAVERKIGKSAFSELSLDAHEWKSAHWAKEKGLYTRIFDAIEELDKETESFAHRLAEYHPEALEQMKKMLWEGTEKWETLLSDRAEISGKLANSAFTKEALARFRKID